jgi:ligand-binding sensor domain-containing protein/signal transduction histidine kinase
MRGIRRLCAALALGLLAAASGAADRWSQLSTPLFEHVRAEHGPPNLATALAQDGDGFLWVGAFGGLARWDGYRLRVYGPDAGQAGFLPDPIVQALHTDSAGRLWVGTNAHGLLRYDRIHDSFVAVAPAPQGLAHVSVLALTDDGAGGLWVGTDAGADRIDASGKVIERLPGTALPDPHVRALQHQGEGTLWLGTSAGLVRHGRDGDRIIAMPGLADQPEIDALCLDNGGRLWIGTRGHGAYVLELASGTVKAVDETDTVHALASESVYAVAEARPGEVWLGTYGQGIVAVNAGDGSTRRLRHDPSVANSLVNDSVWAILRDRSGLVWAATGRGLSRTDPQQEGVLTIAGGSSRHPDGLGDANVHAVLATPDGRIWLGTGESGIEVFDPQGQRVAAQRPDPAHPQTALPADRVLALAGDERDVWSAGPRGLYRSGDGGKSISRVVIAGQDPALRINTLALDTNRLWVGTRDAGLWALARDGSTQVRILGLPDERIATLYGEAGRMLWIGTRNGLARLDRNTMQVETISADARDPQALGSNYVNALLLDQHARLWAGAIGGGISIMTGRDANGRPRFRHLGLADGLPSNNIMRLLEDRTGRVWASTDNGVAVVDPDNWSVHALRRADGVGVNNMWTGAGAATPAGELLFGGSGGLAVIRPGHVARWAYRPEVVITEVQVGGKRVAPGFAASAILSVAPEANSLTVEFAALDLSAPEHNRYAYRLDGFDQDWIETDATRRLATYTNLPPGRYRLRLRGSNRDGVWSEKEGALALEVLPAWHQSWWARLLAVAALLLAVSLLLRLRTSRLRRRQAELEAEVGQRTDELRSQATALVAANSELTLAAETLRQLDDVGRDIAANLDALTLFDALRRHAATLLDAHCIAIYRVDNAGNALDMVYGRTGEAALEAAHVAIDDLHDHAAKAARDREDVEAPLDVLHGGPGTGRFAPLIAANRLLGVMAICSPIDAASGERERLIFRTLSAYGAIAMANADARAELVRKEKLASLGSLVAGMAHEVNTPLGIIISSISGAGQAIGRLREAALSGKVNKAMLETTTGDAAEFVDLGLRNANRVASMVDSFKSAVAHRESERSDVIDLATYLPQVAALVRGDLEAGGHAIVFDVAPGLTVTTVADALTEALTRVLANVLDHAFHGRRGGTVTISARPAQGSAVDISVADDGHGIAPDHLPRVFDPFFTTQSGQFGHAGLGLNVAFNHVSQRLRGRISIDSQPGSGTRVTIRVG